MSGVAALASSVRLTPSFVNVMAMVVEMGVRNGRDDEIASFFVVWGGKRSERVCALRV